MKVMQLRDLGLKNKWILMAVSKERTPEAIAKELSKTEVFGAGKKTNQNQVQNRRKPDELGRKKRVEITFEDSMSDVEGNVTDEEVLPTSGSSEGSVEIRKRTSKKAASSSSSLEKEPAQKVTRRRRKKVNDLEDEGSQTEISDIEEEPHVANVDADSEEELDFDGGEDISFSSPPLVCCFGAAQHAFVPSGRPSNRLVDHEWHERMKDVRVMLPWFLRAWAVKLPSWGNMAMTISVSKRGGLRMTTTKPSAEDSLLKSEINIDVLKEAKMFYFNTFSLLDPNMRLTTLRATKISKKLGGVVFYDVNLPFPLWESGDKATTFIQQAWDLADIIEVTKQELEFLCGIKPSERFDTKDNDRSKFTHYPPEVIAPLWHENLKVLFVTNGTSKIHYYTKEHNGAVLGLEDVPLTPYTSDMSASGDGIIAGIIRMLTVQPHLMTDKGYLERTLKYVISCGVVDQWLQARRLGYPPKEGMEDDVVPDDHGIKSVTEREYRTLVPVS
ncbi:fructokinase-like 2, chloroplastic [Nicotiana attenuata]|uniref:Fructokinase-like 2, chloroplastic n=1 Tax=Nicotiana attenuata TaxID=49451 RepID=A0A1J6IL52_NICAT|nr:fructokinase-like 2, chloroplastic [Nicotiana attenuata]